ncbi:MAG: hypothetical protein HY650_14175 [Acidobacteria bacterium]|nr:hypothetical protein [Acidobacteriota bacterium]
MNKPNAATFEVGDEVSFAAVQGMRYGAVVRLLPDAVEILFEDGRKEIHKARDRALRLLKKAQSASSDRGRPVSSDIEEVRRAEIHRGK